MNFKANLSSLMEQAKEMQTKMQDAQKELTNLRVVGEAGGGLVKITMNGRHDVVKVSIDESIITTEERDMLEDLVAAAINNASRKIEKASKDKIAHLTSGINLPNDLMGDDDA